MVKVLCRIVLVVFWFAGLCKVHAAAVTFRVNLHYQVNQKQFTPGANKVLVYGSFGEYEMTDIDGDFIFEKTVEGFVEENQIQYGFRMVGTSITNEAIESRKYVVQENSNANVIIDWFNNQQPPYPYTDFFTSTVKTIPGEVVRFFEDSQGGEATSWQWSFQGGNPQTSNVKNPAVVYSAPGVYAVKLTASNANGGVVSKAITITITSIDSALNWWNDQVFYQVYPYSFLDTDGNGTGDLRGIINKLDYLNDGNATTTTDLGVTALYMMPVHPATNIHYGGYEITDFKTILSQLGTQADFDELVTKAHARGMKVIMDMVFNHSSSSHPWFKEARAGNGSKYEDYYVFNNTNAVSGWGWRDNSSYAQNNNFKYFWSQFNGSATADFNIRSQSARNTMKDISSHWLSKRIDGFRLDAPIYFYGAEDGGANTDRPETYAYVREWCKHIRDVNPNSFTVGETWFEGCYKGRVDALVANAAKYVYDGFDIGFQFNITYGIQEALNQENKDLLIEPVEASIKYYPNMQFGVLQDNHDTYIMCDGNYSQLRLKDRLKDAKDSKAKVAAAFVLTSPGVPFLYYGDEIGASGGYARKPMQWNATANAGFTSGTPWETLAGDYGKYNTETEKNDADSFLNLYKKLIALRVKEKALRRGTYKTIETSSPNVYAFTRSYDHEVIVVILNLSASTQNDVTLSMQKFSNVDRTYALQSMLDARQINSLSVNNGAVRDWIPVKSIGGNDFYILKIQERIQQSDHKMIKSEIGKKNSRKAVKKNNTLSLKT